MLAPSRVPMVSAPFMENFMLPVPEASLPASGDLLRQVGGRIDPLAVLDVEVGHEDDPQRSVDRGSWLMTSATALMSLMISLAM